MQPCDATQGFGLPVKNRFGWVELQGDCGGDVDDDDVDVDDDDDGDDVDDDVDDVDDDDDDDDDDGDGADPKFGHTPFKNENIKAKSMGLLFLWGLDIKKSEVGGFFWNILGEFSPQ